jgi:two-component system, NarL family, nitrate/nitrite response regulator NarL
MGPKKLTHFHVAPAQRTRVIVADPYPVIVHGVRTMVEDDPRFQVVAEASTLSSFKKKVMTGRPEVALLDWAMASQDLEFTTSLVQADLHSPSIIFLTVSENCSQKQEMLRLGASAFVSKWCSSRKLRSAVWRASTKRRPPEAASAELSLADSPAPLVAGPEQRIEKLTSREREMLPLVCSGLKNKEIALQLGIAESTVWHHLTAVFTKLQVDDRLGLAAFAYSHRLVFPALQSHQEPALKAEESFSSASVKYSPAADRIAHEDYGLNPLNL